MRHPLDMALKSLSGVEMRGGKDPSFLLLDRGSFQKPRNFLDQTEEAGGVIRCKTHGFPDVQMNISRFPCSNRSKKIDDCFMLQKKCLSCWVTTETIITRCSPDRDISQRDHTQLSFWHFWEKFAEGDLIGDLGGWATALISWKSGKPN